MAVRLSFPSLNIDMHLEMRALCALMMVTTMALVGGCSESGSTGKSSQGAESSEIATLLGDPLPADASLRAVLEHPDVLERAQRLGRLLQTSGPEKLDEYKTEFELAALDRGDIEYALFANWWARFDPRGAFNYCQHTIRTERPRIILEVVRTWARVNPAEASEQGLLSSIAGRTPAAEPDLIDSVVVGWFESGKPGLEDWILGQGTDELGPALAAYARMRVLKDGANETLEWTLAAPFHADIRRGLMTSALALISHQDPELAVEWLDRAEKEAVDIRTFLPRIANGWSHHDPSAAMNWVLTFPENHERARSVQKVARRWFKIDLPSAVEWLKTVAGQEWADPALYAGLRAQVTAADFKPDWPTLIEDSTKIVNQGRRVSIQGWMMQRWRVVDLEAANAWVEANPDVIPESILARIQGISPAEREKIMKAIGASS